MRPRSSWGQGLVLGPALILLAPSISIRSRGSLSSASPAAPTGPSGIRRLSPLPGELGYTSGVLLTHVPHQPGGHGRVSGDGLSGQLRAEPCGVVDLPGHHGVCPAALWTSILVRTYAWMVLLQANGVLNNLLRRLHVIDEPLRLMYNEAGVVSVWRRCFLPFAILPVFASLRNIDPRLTRPPRSWEQARGGASER